MENDMSYCRSPFYIYPTGDGVQFEEGKFLDNAEIDVFLYKLSLRPEEMKQRIENGIKVINDYVNYWKQQEDGKEFCNHAVICNLEMFNKNDIRQ
jgi:hypothetical protein